MPQGSSRWCTWRRTCSSTTNQPGSRTCWWWCSSNSTGSRCGRSARQHCTCQTSPSCLMRTCSRMCSHWPMQTGSTCHWPCQSWQRGSTQASRNRRAGWRRRSDSSRHGSDDQCRRGLPDSTDTCRSRLERCQSSTTADCSGSVGEKRRRQESVCERDVEA